MKALQQQPMVEVYYNAVEKLYTSVLIGPACRSHFFEPFVQRLSFIECPRISESHNYYHFAPRRVIELPSLGEVNIMCTTIILLTSSEISSIIRRCPLTFATSNLTVSSLVKLLHIGSQVM